MMNFQEKGGGVTPIRKIKLQIFVPPEKKHNIVFRNEGGGGQRPFGVLPKIHPSGHRSSLRSSRKLPQLISEFSESYISYTLILASD